MNVAGVASPRRASWIFCRLSCSIYAALRCFDFYAIAEAHFYDIIYHATYRRRLTLGRRPFEDRNPNRRSSSVTFRGPTINLMSLLWHNPMRPHDHVPIFFSLYFRNCFRMYKLFYPLRILNSGYASLCHFLPKSTSSWKSRLQICNIEYEKLYSKIIF